MKTIINKIKEYFYITNNNKFSAHELSLFNTGYQFVDLRDAYLHNADLHGADLHNADLHGADDIDTQGK